MAHEVKGIFTFILIQFLILGAFTAGVANNICIPQNSSNVCHNESDGGRNMTTSKTLCYAHIGCYHKINSSMNHTESTNSPDICSTRCNTYDYFGLHNTTCACMREKPSSQNSHNCQYNCTGSSHKCGGSTTSANYYDVYEKMKDDRYDKGQQIYCTNATTKATTATTNATSNATTTTVQQTHAVTTQQLTTGNLLDKTTFRTTTAVTARIVDTTYDMNMTTTGYETTNSTRENVDNSLFVFQLGAVMCVSVIVIIMAAVACCVNKHKHKQEKNRIISIISPCIENEAPLSTVSGTENTNRSSVTVENYSNPWDSGIPPAANNEPHYDIPVSENKETGFQVEIGCSDEYHHLDFTNRAESTPTFIGGGEYDTCNVRSKALSIFEQPWDTPTSRVNKIFYQIRQSVVQGGREIRKSIFKGQSQVQSSQTNVNNADMLHNYKDIEASDNAHSCSVTSQKENEMSESPDRSFPVLPYSERIDVKSTDVYAEPNERRISLKDRLLQIVATNPLRIPFELGANSVGTSPKNSKRRMKSKIYSMAKPIDEIDESEA